MADARPSPRHRVFIVAEAVDPIQSFADILAEHGPLPEDDLIRRLGAAGVADPEDAFDGLLDQIGAAAGQLVDERWVWLPTLLAGRVFTHRLSSDDLTHDILPTIPDLAPATALCDTEPFTHFADGSQAYVALASFDHELLSERGIPPDFVDPSGSLLLAPGTLAALGASVGDLVALRLTTDGMTIERVDAVEIPRWERDSRRCSTPPNRRPLDRPARIDRLSGQEFTGHTQVVCGVPFDALPVRGHQTWFGA